jgi:hypothetical protein
MSAESPCSSVRGERLWLLKILLTRIPNRRCGCCRCGSPFSGPTGRCAGLVHLSGARMPAPRGDPLRRIRRGLPALFSTCLRQPTRIGQQPCNETGAAHPDEVGRHIEHVFTLPSETQTDALAHVSTPPPRRGGSTRPVLASMAVAKNDAGMKVATSRYRAFRRRPSGRRLQSRSRNRTRNDPDPRPRSGRRMAQTNVYDFRLRSNPMCWVRHPARFLNELSVVDGFK